MKKMATNSKSLPLLSYINFSKVFEFWEEQAERGGGAEQARAKYVLDQLASVPELREPFEDTAILKKYEEEIALLLSCFFPQALQKNEIKAATLPFENIFFCETERFANILADAGEEATVEFRHFDDNYLVSASWILAAIYGAQVNLSRPMVFDLWSETRGMTRTYRGFMNGDFSELRKTSRSPDLTPEQIKSLIDNANDLDLWKKLIPPGSFELHGFGLLTIFDITADEALSKLKLSLIDQDALRNETKLKSIRTSLRQIFGIDDLQLGISVLEGKNIHTLGQDACKSILLSGVSKEKKDALFCEYSEEHLLRRKEAMSISNLDDIDFSGSNFLTAVEKSGIKSYIVNPLVHQGKVLGLLELGSAKPGAVNTTMESKLEEILPLVTAALHRSVDDYWTNLEAIIKEKCTAIHPAVEWRFMDAAAQVYASGKPKSEVEMEEIVFERVHPLFGQMDIRGSSQYRDKGIQKDLLTQLQLAKNVLEAAMKKENLIIYEQLIDAIEKRVVNIRKKLQAGDESSTLDFLKYEVESLFEYLKNAGTAAEEIEAYEIRIDPKIKMVYEGRRDYEETVTSINEHVSAYIENSQLVAQKMFPHYFEKYKTDGVEYNMYVGGALVQDRAYHEMYLKNLRLWQLVMTCEVENMMHRVAPDFKVPLEIASLILVQNKSLDIKFRFDEKQFDVDGAYNARYEIIKKRVDKAKLKGKKERLTMPGKIAIVYSSEDEKREYDSYLKYLINKDYILSDVEHVELEELQGASGLKAMRIAVNYEKNTNETQLSRQVEELISELN